VPGRCLLALADDLLDLLPDRVQAYPQRLQRLGRDTFALAGQAEQEMLGADVIVIEPPGLLLSQNNNTPRPVGNRSNIACRLALPSTTWPPAQSTGQTEPVRANQ
jgi:hypothetical protein